MGQVVGELVEVIMLQGVGGTVNVHASVYLESFLESHGVACPVVAAHTHLSLQIPHNFSHFIFIIFIINTNIPKTGSSTKNHIHTHIQPSQT